MSSLKVLGERLTRTKAMVAQHGGWGNAFKIFKRTDDLKVGTFIGEDQLGNKYYENTYYFKVTIIQACFLAIFSASKYAVMQAYFLSDF